MIFFIIRKYYIFFYVCEHFALISNFVFFISTLKFKNQKWTFLKMSFFTFSKIELEIKQKGI